VINVKEIKKVQLHGDIQCVLLALDPSQVANGKNHFLVVFDVSCKLSLHGGSSINVSPRHSAILS